MLFKVGMWTEYKWGSEGDDYKTYTPVLLVEAADGAFVPFNELPKYQQLIQTMDNREYSRFYRFNTPDLIELIYYEY